ncbi:MAG: sel1 repeat family protein, partial [Pseudolabrys sp.]
MRNKISRSLIIATLTLSFIEIRDVAFAGPFEDSMAAYDRGDYATMLQLLRPLAERGDAQAQNSL